MIITFVTFPNRGPKYDVVGQATLTLSDVQDEIGIFDLNKNMTGSSGKIAHTRLLGHQGSPSENYLL